MGDHRGDDGGVLMTARKISANAASSFAGPRNPRRAHVAISRPSDLPSLRRCPSPVSSSASAFCCIYRRRSAFVGAARAALQVS
ncbi:hypothetical protein QJS10_CPB22g00521 [Acorus calamus]|uniref:Uncharacterized protein n=1 Tax=Acorus calamus TaxID=4465 RepID=A0AAV9BYT1_ACOCL|nr:hypothetical protein QJS10_CPB22g00521 [Acorus calamus]